MKAPVENGEVDCNIILFDHERGFLTEFRQEKLRVKDGYVDISADEDLKYAAVINRYGLQTMGKAIVRGYGIKTGAVASTVAHDCHNVVVIYDKPENALKVISRLKENAGGYVSVMDGQVLAEMKLPVAGLMSNTPIDVIAAQSKNFKESLKTMGMTGIEFPLFVMAILPLPVVPNARLTDLGMIDIITQQFIPVFRS